MMALEGPRSSNWQRELGLELLSQRKLDFSCKIPNFPSPFPSYVLSSVFPFS